jgi:bacteriorhodopsin
VWQDPPEGRRTVKGPPMGPEWLWVVVVIGVLVAVVVLVLRLVGRR